MMPSFPVSGQAEPLPGREGAWPTGEGDQPGPLQAPALQH